MVYSLFLDAEAWPHETCTENFIICRTFDDAKKAVEHMTPKSIVFGCLGATPERFVEDCLDFVNWLIRFDAEEDILDDEFEWSILKSDFSADIDRVMRNYMRAKF